MFVSKLKIQIAKVRQGHCKQKKNDKNKASRGLVKTRKEHKTKHYPLEYLGNILLDLSFN